LKQNVILKKDITNFLKSVKTYQKAGLGGITYHKQKWEGKWKMFILKKNSRFWTCMFFFIKRKLEKNPHFEKTFYSKLKWSQKVEIGKI